jgi:tetratricopeptide (TPR) repeat protein
VKFDPYDRASYNEIIHYYTYIGNKKEAQTWIDTLVERFPEDIPALLMASDSAFDRKAYKKAIGFLDHILQFDPVNKDAKSKKVFIHITKARKNIDEKKFHIARKEFEAAAECCKKNTDEYGGVLIKWGCMELLTKNTQKGDVLTHEGFTLTGQGLRALYLIVVESKRMGLASSVYKKYTRLFEEQLKLPVTEGKVMELIDTALPYLDISYKDKENDIKTVVDYLIKAARLNFDKGNLLKICAYLKECASYSLLKTYSENGVKKWSDDGLFLYYFIWGKYQGKFKNISDMDIRKLERAHKMAIDGQNVETLSKLDEILDQVYQEPFPFDSDMDPELIEKVIEKIKSEKGEDFFNFFEQMLEHMVFEESDEEETDNKKKRPFPKKLF